MFLRMVREGKTNEENSTSAFTFCLYDDLDFIRINELSYIYLVAISVEGLILHLRGYKNGYWKFWKQDVRDYPWRVKAFFYGDYL